MRWTLDAAPGSAAIARDLVRGHLVSCSEEVERTAVLLTDELVANAVVHGEGPLELSLRLDGQRLHVAVSDVAPAAALTVDRDPGEPRPSGRGLYLVDTLSTRWGVEALPQGKRVWFELEWA